MRVRAGVGGGLGAACGMGWHGAAVCTRGAAGGGLRVGRVHDGKLQARLINQSPFRLEAWPP
jgi:hypothetical protein